ncbi:LppU/SCO3897 family protein [Amycolatopsis saalfeldensis]|uniref:Uncharacterized protein n=1 Tax=Amycolatopsis saalfeldensis TaxID=394193 RepID=A0A1H8WI30_9PSEU|nr:hypothetical protein [Amycolatopsis saalfeldensis]SEP27269.1 hypothetical protein SAMN04489732_105207 [Amycolatopsis saalfeldensis]
MSTPPFGVPSAANPFQPPGYAPPPPPQPGRPGPLGARTKALLGGAVVVALGLGSLGAFGVAAIAHSAGPPSAGSCLYLSQETIGTQSYHGVGCSDQRATYRVDNVVHGSSTCHGSDYVRFQVFGGSSRSTGSTPDETLCLALNVSSGDCLRNVDDETSVRKVTCTDPTAQARVSVHDGDDSQCDAAATALAYAGPPARTVCLIPSGENI